MSKVSPFLSVFILHTLNILVLKHLRKQIMCKETKLGLAAGLLMIIIMAIGFRTTDNDSKKQKEDINLGNMVREKQNAHSDPQFQTTSRTTKNGPTLE